MCVVDLAHANGKIESEPATEFPGIKQVKSEKQPQVTALKLTMKALWSERS